MQSRMDKYQTEGRKRYERTRRNTKLYEEVYDDLYRDTTYQNMQVIDTAKEINLSRLKDMLGDKYDTRQYRTMRNYSVEDIDTYDKPDFSNRSNKVYDINEIINDAKNKRAFIEEAKEKQKYLDFKESRNISREKRYESLENEEKELEELINTMAISRKPSDTDNALDILSDLKGEENTIVTNPISSDLDEVVSGETKKAGKKKQEKVIASADKTFYTDSNMFTKNDFEDFSTLTKEISRTRKTKKVIIVILIMLILALIGYFVVTKFIIK